MLPWALIFVVVVLLTALFGLIGMSAAAAGILGVLFYFSLALLALALVEGAWFVEPFVEPKVALGGTDERLTWLGRRGRPSGSGGGGIMRAAVIIGILLIVFGVVSLAYQGITYTEREEVLDIGPIEATTETKKTIPLPPILGGVALAAGTVLVVLGSRKH